MKGYRNDDLSIDVEQDAEAVRLLWRGKSRARDPAATLDPFFEQAGADAQAKQLRLVFALNALEYVNSATLAALIKAITRLRVRKVPVEITYDADVGWQWRSAEALRVLEDEDGMVRFTATKTKG